MSYENEEPQVNIVTWVFRMFRGDEDIRVPTLVRFLLISVAAVNRL